MPTACETPLVPRAGVQGGQHLAQRQHPQLRRGELDRQRQPVKPAAQLADQPGVVVGDLEAGQHRPGPVEEELHGFGARQPRRCLGREGQW